MNQKYLDILIPAIKKMGYELIEIGEPNSSGFFRPKVTRLDGQETTALSIAFDGDRTFYLTDFAEQLMPELKVTIDGDMSEIDKSKMPGSIIGKTEAERKEYLAKKQAEFQEAFDAIKRTDLETNDLLKKKKLKLYGKAFIAESYSFGKGAISNPLIVPFFNIDKEVIGAQVCFLDKNGKSKKFAIPGSTFKESHHVLQDGERIEAVNLIPLLVCESYTTACEVAEAQPKATVVCSAGIGGVEAAGKALDVKEHYKIFICDKTKHNEPNAQLDKLINKFTAKGVPYIQLDKMDTCLLDMTDFNDYALEYGKTAVKREVDIQTKRWLPLAPEVLMGDGKTYSIVSRVNNKIMNVPRGKVIEARYGFANSAFWAIFDKIHHMGRDDEGNPKTAKPLKNWLDLNESRNAETVPYGVGIYKDTGGYVMNTYRGRFVNSKKGTFSTFDLKPLGDNIYVNCSNDKKELNLEESFTDDHLKKLISLWKMAYDMDKSYLLGLLGYAVQATYATFSPHRAHMWVTGASGSGKSRIILERFLYRLLRGIILPIQNTTEAGLSQQLTPDTGEQNSPVISIDEAGSDSSNKQMRMDEVIKLARETATDDGTKVSLRGTKEQDGRVYRRTCSLALASTTENLDDMQDLSRFIIFNLSPQKFKFKKAKDFDTLSEELQELNAVFLRACLDGAEHFKELFNLVNDEIRKDITDIHVYAQKVTAITACVAGAAALLKVAKGCDSKHAAKLAVKHCKEFIDTQMSTQTNKAKEVNSIKEDIIQADILIKGDRYELLDLLKGDNDFYYYKKYGVRIKDDDLIIKHTGFKLNRLLTNNKLVLNKVHDVKGKLLDAVERDDDISLGWSKCALNKNYSIQVFRIKLNGE